MKAIRTVVSTCCLLAAVASGAGAQEPTTPSAAPSTTGSASTPSNGWNFVVEPYLLFPNMTGESGVRGLTSDVDASTGDIFGALDFGAMLYLEMHNSRWAVSLDGTYMDLGASGTTPLGSVDIDMKQSGVMLAGYRRVCAWAELMAGVQFNSIEGSLKGSGPLGVDQGGDESWVDPYLGARLVVPRADKWRLAFFGCAGGFGVGSEFAWQAFPEVGYRFNPLFELTAGYRAIGMDYENGEGNEKFVYELVTHGPQVGGKFHF